MAGDWIPMRTDLAEDPAVIGIADATGLDEGGVVGRLHRLWSWASWHTEDGDVKGVTLAWVNRHVQSDGFAEAMVKVGWLIVTKSGVKFPRFEEWNSQSAKKRRLTARRMASLRANKSDARSVTKTSPDKRTEENIREQKDKDPAPDGVAAVFDPLKVPIPSQLDTPRFREAWSLWAKHRKEIRHPLKETMSARQLKSMAAMGIDRAVAMIEYTISKGWQGLQEPDHGRAGNGTANAVGNSRGYGGAVEPNRVRTDGILDQVARERERPASACGSAGGGQGEMQSSGPGDGQEGVF